jgi:hypothetical protein
VIYLSGVSSAPLRELQHPRIGIMVQPGNGYSRQVGDGYYHNWAADNGCFAGSVFGSGIAFRGWDWLAWLNHMPRAGCLFAVCPDVLGDWALTNALAQKWMGQVRALGFPVAYVAQDGVPQDKVPWLDFDCLFVGGTTAYKLSSAAYDLMAEAQRWGKWTHMGRVNSFRRLRAAASAGYDSADGTFLKFGPNANLPRLLGWMERLHREPFLHER